MKNYIYSERADLFEPNIYIEFLVQITGNPSTDQLICAVKKAFLANEATMSKIVLEKGNACYERMEESGCKVTVTADDWKTIIRSNEKIPFAIDKGEMMRVFIISSEEETSLFIMAHHLVGDGKSITYFIEDVMKALSGEDLVEKALYLITKDSFPPKSALPFFYKMHANSFNRKWKKTGHEFSWEDYYHTHNVYWKERSSVIVYEHFSKDMVDQIRAHAKAIGVSMNSFLATAFLEANRNQHTIGMAVDARIDGNRCMSNQATGISVDLTFSDNISFDENARRLHRKIYKKLNRPVMKYFILQYMPLFIPTLVDSLLVHTYGLYQNKTTQKLARVLGYTKGKTRDLGITNLAKLDIPNVYGPYGIRNMLFIPPVVSYARHIIGVATMEDGMTVTYHYMSDQDDKKEKEFFSNSLSWLLAAVSP